MMNVFSGFARSMRPRQMLLKNGVVFAAIIFANKLRAPDAMSNFLRVLCAYAIFAVLSGVVYVFNDILDREQDREHPEKCKRPIAAGDLPVKAALAGVVLLALFACSAAFVMAVPLGVAVSIYLVMSVAYSVKLKHIVILDTMVIAFGFVMRVVGGALVIPGLEVSLWLVICSFLLALFLGFSKRRHEITILGEDAGKHRKILSEYSPYFLDQIIAVVTSSTLIAYILYTMDPGVQTKHGTKFLFFTIPFVLYGIFRYLYLIHQKERGGNPAKVMMSDIPLLVNIVGWVGMVVLVLYTDIIQLAAKHLFFK